MADKPILVAVDFAEASRRALETAQAIAAGLRAPIMLLHVYTLPLYMYPGIEPLPVPPPVAFEPELDAATRKAIAAFGASYGIPASRTLVREGDPVDEILATVATIGAQMIVMGTHGRRGLSHLLLGSVAEQVVRRASVPVLTVRVRS